MPFPIEEFYEENPVNSKEIVQKSAEVVANIINTTPDAATSLNFYGIVKTDQVHGIKSTINNLCPAKLRIYPLTSHGSIANKELINIKFIRAIENDEQI